MKTPLAAWLAKWAEVYAQSKNTCLRSEYGYDTQLTYGPPVGLDYEHEHNMG